MTNDELKNKMVKVLRELRASKPIVTNDYGLQIISCTTDREIADALIAAGFGDVKDLQAQVDVLEITNIALQAGYDDAEKDRLYWVDKYKEAEHRADVAERALREFAVQCGCDKCPFLGRCNISPDVEGDYQGCFNMYLSIAEKELAEERKDD